MQHEIGKHSGSFRWAKRIAVIVGVGGGVAGLIASAQGLNALTSASAHFLWSVFACFYALGVWLGLRVLDERPRALEDFSKYLWLQVPVLQSNVLTYAFAMLGSCTWVYRDWPLFDFGWTLGSGWAFSLFSVEPEFGVGVNFWALALLSLLRILRKRSAIRSISQ